MAAVAKPNNGKVSRRANALAETTHRYTCDSEAECIALVSSLLPAGGAMLYYSYEPRGDAGAYWDFEAVTVASKPGGGGGAVDGETEDFCDASTETIPIERHPSYRTKWNYDLYQQVSESGTSEPSWWTSATDRSDAKGTQYRWTKDDPGDGFEKVKERTKILEDYRVPAPIVTSYYYHSNKTTAEAQLQVVGTLSAPPDDFGYTGLAWLVLDSKLRWNGRKYEVETRRQGSPVWDTEVYFPPA